MIAITFIFARMFVAGDDEGSFGTKNQMTPIITMRTTQASPSVQAKMVRAVVLRCFVLILFAGLGMAAFL